MLSVVFAFLVSGDIVWSVHRRFRDFELLHKNISKLLDKESVPKLPPKKVGWLLSPEFTGGCVGDTFMLLCQVRMGKSKFNKQFLNERKYVFGRLCVVLSLHGMFLKWLL